MRRESVLGGSVSSPWPSDRPPFSLRTQQQLCAELLGLPEMSTRERRDHLVRHLAREYPGVLSAPRDTSPWADLSDILATAYDYPGALRTLFTVVRSLYVASERILAIKGLIDSVEPEDLLTAGERERLLDLLAEAEPAAVAAAFHFSHSRTVEDVGLDPGDLPAVAGYLEQFPGTPLRLPPYFDFVDHVSHGMRQAVRSAAHRWMDEVSLRLGFTDRAAVDRLCLATQNRLGTENTFFLVAEITPDRNNRDKFFLAAWRQRGDEPEEPAYQDDQSMSWDETIRKADSLMRSLVDSVSGTSAERVLEFILPRRLVTRSVDQWKAGSVLPSSIGTTYPLVLRSLDRLAEPDLHLAWARNWRWIKEHGRSAGRSAFHVVRSHDIDVIQALRGALLRDGPPAAVVMLKALPESEDLAEDAYTAALRGGAPVMIWSRDDATNGDLAAFIESVADEGVLDLPRKVFQLRLRALADNDPAVVGEHVALIFDDHDRLPERFRYRAKLRSPTQRRSL